MKSLEIGVGFRSVQIVVAAAMCALPVVALGADDNASTYYTNGLVNFVSGDVVVGTNGVNNYLEVSNGTTLTNSGNGVISQNATASGNSALVSGLGSKWNTLGITFVGDLGANATLTITNGGKVNTTAAGYIGYYVYDSVSNNIVKVTGTGSGWTIGTALYVGSSGHDDQLIIENGGTVTNLGGTLIGNGAGGSNNLLFVNGTGSTFMQSSGDFGLGGGGNNKLVVANGGTFKSPNIRYSSTNSMVAVTNGGFIRTGGITISETAGAPGGSFLVSGIGSMVTNSGALSVGSSGANATLRIEKGGTFTNATTTSLGVGAGSSNNLMIVTDAGSIYKGGDLALGGGGSNTLVVANGGTMVNGNFTFANKNNQILITNGGTASAVAILIGSAAAAVDNRILVSGTGSVLNATYTDYGLLVGYSGATGSKLQIDDGGIVNETAGNLYVGGWNGATASNNSVSVTGNGSQLNINKDVRFGWGGAGASASVGNQITVAGGGKMTVGGASYLGYVNAVSNVVTVTGSGSVYSNDLTKDFFPNYAGVGNQLIVTNGGHLVTRNARMGTGGGTDGLVKISGPTSTWTMADATIIGETGNRNHLVIENGATVNTATNASISYSSSYNDVTVSGNGSTWNQGGELNIGYFSPEALLVITNGGAVNTTGISYIGRYYGTVTNAIVKVTGVGSTWTVGTGMYVGYSGSNDQLIIENGGTVTNNGAGAVGYSGGNDLMRVDGAGSTYVQNSGIFYVGFAVGGNQLIVTNGGKVVTAAGQLTYGNFTPGEGGTAIITGNGSVWTNSGVVSIGGYTGSGNVRNTLTIKNGGEFDASSLTVGSGTDSNQVLVTSGGLMEANTLSVGSQPTFTHNSISNIGGIYQFTTATPSIAPGLGTISITDGTVSFRSVSNAPTGPLAGMNYTGNDTFRLNNSSNAAVSSYTFNTGLGSSNYYRLELVNGSSRWQGANLTIGSGGSLLVSNASSAFIAANVNSTGAITVVQSKITYASNVVINGSYISDPSTNTYLADLIVNQSGTLAGGAGDLFDFKKSFYIHSTNRIGFNLSQSAVMFSGGGIHTNAITGQDMGGTVTAFDTAFTYQTNYAYGELHIGSAADQVCFECGNIPVVPGNALYVGWLDLLNNASLVANLHASNNINIYYSGLDARNAYLGNQTFQLTQCDGVTLGGFLLPVIPEPSSSLLLGSGLIAALRMRRKLYRTS